MTDLKPCPFCGGINIKSGGDDKIIWFMCLDCDASGPNHYIGPMGWNTRAPVKVKPLIWDPWDGGMTIAIMPLGKFILGADYRMIYPTGRSERWETEKAAKDAAYNWVCKQIEETLE